MTFVRGTTSHCSEQQQRQRETGSTVTMATAEPLNHVENLEYACSMRKSQVNMQNDPGVSKWVYILGKGDATHTRYESMLDCHTEIYVYANIQNPPPQIFKINDYKRE